jgi:hypothetical protein
MCVCVYSPEYSAEFQIVWTEISCHAISGSATATAVVVVVRCKHSEALNEIIKEREGDFSSRVREREV